VKVIRPPERNVQTAIDAMTPLGWAWWSTVRVSPNWNVTWRCGP